MGRTINALFGAILFTWVIWIAGGVPPASAADYYPWFARYGGGS